MIRQLQYQGKVKDGQIELPRRLRKEVTQAFDGHGIEVIFKRKRKTRSLPQNSYYWGIVLPMILERLIELGNELQIGNKADIETVHRLLKDMFLDNGREIWDAEGNMMKEAPSTKHCTTFEFMEYLDKVQKWAAEFLGINIPDPNEQMEFWGQTVQQ